MLRKFRRKFGSSAPRLSVRPHIPWYVRWAITLPFIFAAGGLIWWAYDSGLELAGFHRGLAEKELDGLRERVAFLEINNKELLIKTDSYSRQSQINQAAMQETAKQVQMLNDENLRLQEDLAFFQNLPLTTGAQAGLSIHRLKVEADALPNEYHCRFLLVQNVQRVGNEFKGRMRLLVSAELAGKKVVLQFPTEVATEDSLSFKFYQRIERPFKLPPDHILRSVEVRVYEGNAREPKVKQLIDFK
jgi:hypothetical protein